MEGGLGKVKLENEVYGLYLRIIKNFRYLELPMTTLTAVSKCTPSLLYV